jgi:branched-chain amino acid transport system substrate-binding protein
MKLVHGFMAAALTCALPAAAQSYKIGASVGLTGYAATVDRAWRDGLQIAVEYLNGKGGLNGRKLELIAEDNRSEPQEAVTVYRKMLASDKVDLFVSGCVSAGNFAAAPMVVKAQIPMLLCSILPQNQEHAKWAFSTLPPARFEVEKRLEYIKEHTKIRRIGVLHDPTPYANLQKAAAEKSAPDYGLQIAGIEQYRQDDADLSVQLSKMASAGAGAVLKIGLGGTTMTAARNIKSLGLDTLMLTSTEDLAVFRPVSEVLGDKFFFVAAPAQVYDALPEGPQKKAIAEFLPLWRAKHGERDPHWGGRAWDAVMMAAAAVQQAKTFEGPKVRDALETISGYQGTGGVYSFSASNHYGITQNPYVLATFAGGKPKVVK